MIFRWSRCGTLALMLLAIAAWLPATAQEEPKKKDAPAQTIDLADGRMTLAVPAQWQRKQPRVNIIEYEFEVPGKDEQAAGRMTIMGAAGSVEENIERWSGQFSGSKAQVDKKTIAGQEVHIVDIAGTFKDQRGPFAPAQTYENYRMLGAVIVTEQAGKYFVKFTGPAETVAAQAEAFRQMIGSLKTKS